MNPVFTRELEQQIVGNVVALGNPFCVVTPCELRWIVFDFAGVNRLPHKFNAELNLPERTGINVNRVAVVNAEAVGKFFNSFRTILLKYTFSGENIQGRRVRDNYLQFKRNLEKLWQKSEKQEWLYFRRTSTDHHYFVCQSMGSQTMGCFCIGWSTSKVTSKVVNLT